MPTGEPSNSSVDCGTGNNSSYRSTIILEGTLAGAGVLVCAASIVVATRLRLYRQMVYRLAVYQVASALAFGITALLDVVQYLVMEQSTGHHPYQPLCLGNAYLSTYTLLVKLAFVVFITVHLFAFAVCYKNFKRLEACYVLISVLSSGVTGVRVPPDYASGRTRGPRILGPPLGLPVRPRTRGPRIRGPPLPLVDFVTGSRRYR